MSRRARIALAAALVLGLTGCSTLQSTVISDSVIAVGLDVPFTGVGPSAPSATAADLAVGAATLSGFSYVDAEGTSVPDLTFGTMTVLSEDPLVVRYTVADGLQWSDGASIDGVDLLLDWVARAHPFAGPRFGSEPDFALSAAKSVELSADRKSLTVAFSRPNAAWAAAFRAPLPAHVAAARAFDLDPGASQAAKDAVIAAVDSAHAGDIDDLSAIATGWASIFDPELGPPPASGPYELRTSDSELVELDVNASYEGERRPTFARYEIRTITDPAAAVQALSIGLLDMVQVAWSEPMRDVLRRIDADQDGLPSESIPKLLVGWFHRSIDHVDPAEAAPWLLWNPWAWAPVDVTGV